jgi:hypothetical protein
MKLQDYQDAANQLNVELETIQAVAKVESRGSGFQPDGKPTILFERHKFSLFTYSKYDKSHPLISNRKAGGYTNNEYTRLNIALRLDETAALRSTSWGMFQIMGFNHQLAGFDTVQDFVQAMRDDPRHHLLAFVNFIRSQGLAKHLQNKNWKAFAKGYNGMSYAKNQYDTKLENAYNHFKLKTIQSRLTKLGYDPGPIDGMMGPKTRLAMGEYEKDTGEKM